MKGAALQDLAIRHIEHLFVPRGLPLVSKGNEIPPTTSILVRGGAGAGKTTLAMALGQGIARAGGGVLLYLSTEFSQAELLYKAQVLRLPGAAVLPWDERGTAKPGDVVTEHLALRVPDEEPLTSAERKSSAIEVAWELLHPSSPEISNVPVRAVVIDAFTLPEADDKDPHLRSDFVAFVQSLERDGISTVLVEESLPGISGWLPFVVDLVFELEWLAEPDTGTLRRRLRCPKSRYARAIAGPHYYGLEDGVPAVWPDLLAIAGRPDATPKFTVSHPAAWFATASEGYARFTRGGIVLVAERSNVHYSILQQTPGVTSVDVRCGTVTTIRGPGADPELKLFDAGDIQDLGWTILRLIRERGVNTAFFSGVEPMMRRPHLEVELLHQLEALRALGLLVVVRSAQTVPHPLASAADLNLLQGPTVRHQVKWPLLGLRSAALWMASAELWASSIPEENIPIPSGGSARGLITRLRATTLKTVPASYRGELQRLLGAQRGSHDNVRMTIELTVLMCQLGSMYHDHLGESGNRTRRSANRWLYAMIGHDAQAAFRIMQDFGTPEEPPGASFLWTSLCAIHARNAASLEILAASSSPEDQTLALPFLLRGLAAQGRATEMQEAARRISIDVEPIILERLIAEGQLFAPDDATRSEGRNRLAALVERADIPSVHRADAAHNLGVASEERGDRDNAARWYLRALDFNPLLDASREAAQRLGAKVPPPPP